MKYLLRDRDGASKVEILLHPVFWATLGLKILAVFFFTANTLTTNTAPFVNYFVSSHFSNPYQWAAGHGIVFPFPALMLYILATPKFIFLFLSNVDSFLLHIPVLVADVAIFLVLTRWLKGKPEKVLWYYWCSPILFVISYVFGFLDIIPIAFLFGFLYFLFKDRYVVACILLGLALATKTGLIILLPFILVYLLKEYVTPVKVGAYMFLAASLYTLLNLPFLFSQSFIHTLSTGGQSFVSSIHIQIGDATIYVVPLIYLGLLMRSLAFQRLSRDMFLLFLAFALGVVTLFVPPEAGWYFWITPFFIYFFIKEDRVEKYPFILLNIFYVLYFLVVPNTALWTAVPGLPILHLRGTATNTAFTLLQGTLLLNLIWIYTVGIQKGTRHKIFYKPYLIGIAGDSASGKSTVAGLITQLFGEHNTLEVAGDDMHKWERGSPEWSRVTHLNPVANNLHEDMEQVLRLKKNESVLRQLYDHTVGRFTRPQRIQPKKVIVVQGLHALYLKKTRELLDLKIFLAPQEDLRRKWKIERDATERGHAPEKVIKQLDERSVDAMRYIEEQRKHADIIMSAIHEDGREQLKISCNNSIHLDPFMEILKDSTGLTVLHEHGDDMQYMFFEGNISHDMIEELAYVLVPGVWEVNRREIRWEDGLKGITQLFLAYVVMYEAKQDHEFY